jgi:hypothetical protein
MPHEMAQILAIDGAATVLDEDGVRSGAVSTSVPSRSNTRAGPVMRSLTGCFAMCGNIQSQIVIWPRIGERISDAPSEYG